MGLKPRGGSSPLQRTHRAKSGAARGAMTTSRDLALWGNAVARSEHCERAFLTPSAAPATLIEHMFAEGDQVLTERQRQILDFLTKYVDAHGYPPTVREIGEAVGLASPSTVHAHLANLERAGLLKRDPTKPRAIELRREPKPCSRVADVHRLPLVGEVAAGGPLLAEDNVEEYLAVPEPLSRGGEEFLLRVKGDSMINAGHPRRRHRRRRARQQDARGRRHRRRAGRRRRDGRRGDAQASLPRATAECGSSPRTTPSSRSTRSTSS